MNTTSLSISKRIAELAPEWNDTHLMWWSKLGAENEPKLLHTGQVTTRDGAKVAPAYTLGELLRKLPDAGIAKVGEQYNSWSQSYDKAHFDDYEDAVCSDDTPEDSLGKLAIKLLEEGIINKEVRNG